MQKQVLDAITSGKIQATNIILGDNIKEQHNIKIDKVEAGGIGLQMVYKDGELVSGTSYSPSVSSEGPTPEPASALEPQQEVELTDGTLDQHLQLFKEAMLKVQSVKYSETRYEKLIAKTYDWYAVLRLGKDLGLLTSYEEMIALMKEGQFNCVPNNPQNLNPYRQHINAEPIFPNWQFAHPSSEPFFRKFKAIADNTYSLYCLACAKHHIKPYGPGRK